MVEINVEVVFSSKAGVGASSETPARKIVVEIAVEIAAQKNIWRQMALAPLGAGDGVNIFMLSVCFSNGGHTQTSFHEK